MPYTPYELDERWEYEMFTEVLSAARYPEKKKFVSIPSQDQLSLGQVQNYDRQLARLIEKAAHNLLQRAGSQGWEPVDAIDAESLWIKGKVRFGEMPAPEDGTHERRAVELITIHIFCRRRIQPRNNAFVELLTEANPALKHLEFDDDLPQE